MSALQNRFAANLAVFWLGLWPLEAMASLPDAGANASPPVASFKPCALLTLEIRPVGSTTLLDGQWLDENVWMISLMPGDHRLEVRKSGFRTHTEDLEARSGERLRLSITLEKEQ